MIDKQVPLSDEQLSEMQHFSLLDGRGLRSLRHTPEVEAAYRAWLSTDCLHDSGFVLRKKKINSPTPQIVRICQECGFQSGGPVSRKEAPPLDELPWLGSYTFHIHEQQRRDIWRNSQSQLYREVENRLLLGGFSYNEYLQSAEWKSLRRRVMERAGDLCEGCRSAKATQVHHLQYTHIGEEFLWELVAICKDCHARAHPEKQGGSGDD